MRIFCSKTVNASVPHAPKRLIVKSRIRAYERTYIITMIVFLLIHLIWISQTVLTTERL